MPPGRGLRQGEKFRLRLTAASAQFASLRALFSFSSFIPVFLFVYCLLFISLLLPYFMVIKDYQDCQISRPVTSTHSSYPSLCIPSIRYVPITSHYTALATAPYCHLLSISTYRLGRSFVLRPNSDIGRRISLGRR